MSRPGASRRWTLVLATGALTLGFSTACSNDKDTTVDDPISTSSTSDLSFDDALQRAQDVAEEVLGNTFGPDATIVPLEDPSPVVVFCADRSDPPKGTPVRAEYDYRVNGADPARKDDYFAAFEKHYTGAGWTKSFGSAADNVLTMTDKRPDSGFTVTVQFAPGNGLLSIATFTPCVAPKDPNNPLGE